MASRGDAGSPGSLGVVEEEEEDPVMGDVRCLEGSDGYRCWGRNEV